MKTVRFTDENNVEGFVRIPGEAGRELADFEVFTENGCEYLCTGDRASVMIGETDILVFDTEGFCVYPEGASLTLTKSRNNGDLCFAVTDFLRWRQFSTRRFRSITEPSVSRPVRL